MFEVKSFQCPNCQQFINDSMTTCKFCSVPLDMQTISLSVANQERVNNAYNKASNLRILAGLLVTTFFLGFIPFLGLIAGILFLIILIGMPFMLIYWQMQFSGIKSPDDDFKQAKNYWWTALFIWLAFIVVEAVFIFLRIAMMR